MTNKPTLETQFEYLDGLRASGVTNMFGAAPYLAAHFGLPDKEARDALIKWMDSYDPDKTPGERATEVTNG